MSSSGYDVLNIEPKYDQQCRYYNTAWGCNRGRRCWYKHIRFPLSPSAATSPQPIPRWVQQHPNIEPEPDPVIPHPSLQYQQLLDLVQTQTKLMQSSLSRIDTMQQQINNIQQQMRKVVLEQPPNTTLSKIICGDLYAPPATLPSLTIASTISYSYTPTTTALTLDSMDVAATASTLNISPMVTVKNDIDIKNVEEKKMELDLEYNDDLKLPETPFITKTSKSKRKKKQKQQQQHKVNKVKNINNNKKQKENKINNNNNTEISYNDDDTSSVTTTTTTLKNENKNANNNNKQKEKDNNNTSSNNEELLYWMADEETHGYDWPWLSTTVKTELSDDPIEDLQKYCHKNFGIHCVIDMEIWSGGPYEGYLLYTWWKDEESYNKYKKSRMKKRK